jgi:hypothetical protein
MGKVALDIIYLPDSGSQPLRAARVSDRQLIKKVAKKAIQNKFDEAQVLKESDDFAAKVKRDEAKRLEKVLRELVPGLCVGGYEIRSKRKC